MTNLRKLEFFQIACFLAVAVYILATALEAPDTAPAKDPDVHTLSGPVAVPGAIESWEMVSTPEGEPEMMTITVENGTGERTIKIQRDMILWIDGVPVQILNALCEEVTPQ